MSFTTPLATEEELHSQPCHRARVTLPEDIGISEKLEKLRITSNQIKRPRRINGGVRLVTCQLLPGTGCPIPS